MLISTRNSIILRVRMHPLCAGKDATNVDFLLGGRLGNEPKTLSRDYRIPSTNHTSFVNANDQVVYDIHQLSTVREARCVHCYAGDFIQRISRFRLDTQANSKPYFQGPSVSGSGPWFTASPSTSKRGDFLPGSVLCSMHTFNKTD